MIRHEQYIPNVDVDDRYGIKNDIVGSNMCCRLKHLRFINRRHEGIEDVDYESRPLAAAVIGVNNTKASSENSVPRTPELCQTWTDIDEQQLYADTKPNCFIILAKPGAGAYSLGEALAKKVNCIHICPRNVILDEIDQNSPSGKCIDFNMKHYNECKINTIISIMKAKLDSPTVAHRGYVLSGIPLVTTSRSEITFFKKLHSEESVLDVDEMLLDFIMNLKKKRKKKKKGSQEELSEPTMQLEGEGEHEEEEEEEEAVPEEVEEEEDAKIVLPQFLLEPCKDIIFMKVNYYDSKKVVLLNQVNEILKTELKPDILINITCPDEDVLTIKSHKYLDYGKNICVVDPFLSTPISTDQRWPLKYSLSEYSPPLSNDSVTRFKYHVKPPINHTDNAIEQLCNYRNIILPFLERKIQDINPKLIIKLDGRTSVRLMLHNISERLEMLSLSKKVIIPQPLYIEDPPEEMQEFWKMVEESNLIKYNNVNFNRYTSLWYTRCPVELKKRKSVIGKPKYAISLFKHVYLLSSSDALISFWKNPRPYLHYQYLEPTCRVVVMGTKSSGKTMISECLSWLFDAPIISYESIINNEKQKKYDSVAQSVLSEIIPTIEDARYEIWQNLEARRIEQLEEWHNTALSNLKKYNTVFTEVNSLDRSAPANLLKKFEFLQTQLSFLPFLDDLDLCKNAFSTKNIMEYAPAKLVITPKKPAIPVLGDPDVTEAITSYIEANELQKDTELTPEDIVNIFSSIIKDIDEQAELATSNYGKYIIDGFAPDPELWDFLSDAKMLPDYTVTIIENREIDQDLREYYANIENTIKHHKEQFLQANDPLIFVKLKNIGEKFILDSESPTSHVQKIVFDSVRDAIENMTIEGDGKNDTIAEEIKTFSQAIETFRSAWESAKYKLEENNKTFIEVELENKSDIEVIEEILTKLRQAYCEPCVLNEDVEMKEPEEGQDEIPKDLLNYNESRFLCETNVYCPIAYFDYGVLWEGKAEFSIKYGNKMHYFSSEENLEKFRKDFTKYQFYNKPFKKMLPLRICVMGAIGSGKTTISKFLAKELGLIHIDFEDAVNNLLMPRHFKKVGRRYENIFTDKNLDEEIIEAFQMGEESVNYISDILYNENELRRMLYDYFEKGTPMLSAIMQMLLKKLWFEDPFVNTGFVIDGFPKGPQDIEDMTACYCIPDLILELESSSEVAIERLASSMLKTWKMQQTEAKNKARRKLMEAKQEWTKFITMHVVAKLIFEDILDEVMALTEVPPPEISKHSNIAEAEPEPAADQVPGETEEPFIVTTYKDMVEQNPEPEDTSEWEKLDEAQERIESRIESVFDFDDENIQNLKDLLTEQRIKVVSVDASKPINKVQRKTLNKLSNMQNRSALFEQTWVVDYVTANSLLTEGYYFLSKFSRICPVFIYENPDAILNPYKVSKRDGVLFPVVHRCYIYYICGEESVRKFRSNPLKYIMCNNILSFQQYPLRLAVLGPPKSGKSTLAEKLAKHYGLICFSKGTAIRNILTNLHWTKLATEMNKVLQCGDCIDKDHILKAVQTVLIDHRSLTHGFVLDGLPECPSEAMILEKNGIHPVLIFDLSTSKSKLIESSQNEIYYDIIKYIPPYSQPYIEYRLSVWSDRSYAIRDFIKSDCQNIVTFDGNESKWQCYQNAKDYIKSVTPQIHYYITNANKDLILPANVMCISNETFKKNMSVFENFCPVCLKKKILRYSSKPVDKNGVVKFKYLYYWICPEHMDMVLKNPGKHLLSNLVSIPEVPARVRYINPDLVYENGICIVTYAEHLPAQIIKPGSYKFAANYKKRIYLLCDNKCMTKFLEKPHMYFDITVFKGIKGLPQICLKKLPNIGYLEQCVGDLLTKACCAVNVVRPKYPGLSVGLSGLLYVALYLKVNNPFINPAAYPPYKKAFQIYEARSKYIINLGLRLRSMNNPFATYPKCCHGFGRKHSDSTVCKPSTIPSDFHFAFLSLQNSKDNVDFNENDQ